MIKVAQNYRHFFPKMDKILAKNRHIWSLCHEAYYALLNISHWDQADIPALDEFLIMWHEIESSNRLHQLTVSLKLNERGLEDGNKASTDYVVAMCADMIGLDSLILDIDNTQVRIVSIHETTLTAKSELSEWCR